MNRSGFREKCVNCARLAPGLQASAAVFVVFTALLPGVLVIPAVVITVVEAFAWLNNRATLHQKYHSQQHEGRLDERSENTHGSSCAL
jgi:hypothetical protein